MFEREDEMIGRVAESLRTMRSTPDTAADARIMDAVRAEAAAQRAPMPLRVLRGGWLWLREPHSVSVTPLKVGAIAAGLLLAAFAVSRLSYEPARPTVAAAPVITRSDTVVVQFVLVAPGARTVALVGDFNGWDAAATPLASSSSPGLWSVALPLLPGRHQYAFVVDGVRWVADPAAPRALGDDFGAPSSVVTVGEHST